MIVRRYGTTVQSVEPKFDSRAMTEIGFLRTREFSMPTEEFFELYEPVAEHALSADAEGDVKDEAEQALLEGLREKIDALLGELGEDEVLVVESEAGRDYPKTRDRTKNVVVDGVENRLYFYWTIDPPLRLGVYRRAAG